MSVYLHGAVWWFKGYRKNNCPLRGSTRKTDRAERRKPSPFSGYCSRI
jgi:hypothetical protein